MMHNSLLLAHLLVTGANCVRCRATRQAHPAPARRDAAIRECARQNGHARVRWGLPPRFRAARSAWVPAAARPAASPWLCFRVGSFDLRDDLVVFHVAGDDEENIVRRVFLGVITADVIGLQLVENVRIADDGEAIRTVGCKRFQTGGGSRGGRDRPSFMSISRRMTSISLASSSGGSEACCMMSHRISIAVRAPVFGTSM